MKCIFLLGRKYETQNKTQVPILWDKRLQTIVNNESADIIRMLNAEFNDLAINPLLDLYPPDLADEIDMVNDWVYDRINDGVYKCGLAKTQKAYDEAADELFQGLDRAEEILAGQRYLVGERITEADVRLFQTLVRFDEVYHVSEARMSTTYCNC